MCGIAGFIGCGMIPEDRIRRTLDLMKNRGPDVQAYRRFSTGAGEVILLHSRLSILDLDARSNQPFTIGPCTLVFNGEIYNYLELRGELERRGVVFHTTSDTEVLLQCYLNYGEKCVERFEGMWAFALYDAGAHRLILSRDRFAEKPLYLYSASEGLYFGSEVKFLKALSGISFKPNRRQVLRYLVNGYKSLYKSGETFFEGVREVPFATTLTVDREGKETGRRYWTPGRALRDMTLDDAIGGFRERFIESVRLRLRADVPLAFCLSGGVDSAAIVSIASKVFGYDVATFSIIDSDERYNERDNIEATIRDLGCRHTLIETSRADFFPRLEDLIRYHDAPVYTISYYIHSFLSEAIARAGFRVVCSGTGADEMVTGYYDHFNLYLYEMRDSPRYPGYLQEWREGMGRFVRNPHLKNPELYFNQPGFRDHIFLDREVFAGFLREPFSEAFTEERYCDGLLHNRMMNEMFHEGTRVILHEDDLNSMRYSIENRSPYLDSRLFEFAYSIPTEHLIQQGYGKFVLREAVKGILNDPVRLDRRKRGFNAAILSLVDFDDPATLETVLSDGPIFELVDREKLKSLLPRKPLPNSVSKFLFYFLNAKIFLEQNQ